VSRRAAVCTLIAFAATAGLALAVLGPAFSWGDEVTHFLRVLRLSKGQPVRSIEDGKAGVEIEAGTRSLILRALPRAKAWRRCAAPISQLGLALHPRIRPRARPVFMVEAGPAYSPVGTAHMSVAAVLVQSVSDRPLLVLYAARLTNLAVWTILCMAALWLSSGLRTTLLALLVTPQSLYMAATCSVDGFMNGVAFLWTALVLHLAREPAREPGRLTRGIVIIGATVVALTKLIYAPLILLLLAVPAGNLGVRWRPWVRLCAISFGVATTVVVAWLSYNYATAAFFDLSSVSKARHEPTAWLQNPMSVLAAVASTMTTQIPNWRINTVWAGTTQCLELLDFGVPLIWVGFGVALVLDGESFHPTAKQRLLGIVVFLLTVVITIAAAIVVWTPATETGAIGVGGRYFLPAMPALALGLVPPMPPLTRHVHRVLRMAFSSLIVAGVGLLLLEYVAGYTWCG